MEIVDQFKTLFEPELVKELDQHATLKSVKAGEVILDIGQTVRWKSFVMKTIRGRFHEMLNVIDQIAFQKLDERLVNYLKEKSKVTGSTLINLSHEQIASELATTRVVISRLLKALENDKKVLLYRNQIKLLREL
jgi:CRP-like cAMP-binding protein